MQPGPDDLVNTAQVAIWRLFEAGLIDEDAATLVFLAIAIGIRRQRAAPSTRADR